MRIRPRTFRTWFVPALAPVIVLIAAGGPNAFAQLERAGGSTPSCAKPTVTIVVRTTELSLDRQNGTVAFAVYAAAGGGFHGTTSGTITVAMPVNTERVQLVFGQDARTFPFTLRAGETTRSSCAEGHRVNCAVFETGATNPNAGTLVSTVFLDPSEAFTPGGANVLQIGVTVR